MATPQESSEEGIACSILERHHSSLSQSMTSPDTVVRICQMLYSKRCVDESVLDKVESANTSIEDKKAILLASVKTKVFIGHRKLHELATVLGQFKTTKSVANNIISDYNDECTELHKTAAKEAVRKNVVDLNKAVSPSFENVILVCKEKDLITTSFRQQLLHTPHKTRCIEFIDCIYNTVGLNPAYLDTFLSILHDEGPATSKVAKSVAKHYGYALPKYEKATSASLTATGTVGGATSVISSDDNVKNPKMVPQYDQMSNEDKASDILRTHYSTLSQSLKDPFTIARLLHGENVISEDAATQIDSAAIKDRITVLLRSVRRAIHDNHQHVKVFGRVLQQLTAGNERVGQDILNDYNKVFPTTSTFSMTSTSSTTTVRSSEATGVRHHITRDMGKEFSAIRGKFGGTFLKVQKALSEHNVSVDDVKNFCKFAYPKCSQEINDCQTMEDVLTFVVNKCTLIDIGILEELIDNIEIDEAKQHIQDYQQAVDDFSQKMRARFPLNQSLLPDGTPHPLRGETITFVIDQDPETTSLDDIKDLQTYTFGKHAKHVKVIVIKETNSIMITCSFPFELTGLLMAEAMKNLKLLKKNGLLKLTIGYYTIWIITDEEEKEETTDVQLTGVTSERERELEQPLQGTDKLNEIISHKDKEVKELQEKVDQLTEQLNLFILTDKRGLNDAKEEMNEETVGNTSDITDQQRDTESELVGQTDETIEELQQPLQGKEDETFPPQTTTPPSLSDTPSDKQMLKQQIKAMIMEIEALKSQLMKSKEEREIEATREIEMLQDKLSEQNMHLIIEEQTSVEIKQEMEGKISSLNDQLREREEEVKKLSTDIKVAKEQGVALEKKYKRERSWKNWKIEYFLNDKNVTVTRGNRINQGSFKVVYEACDKDDDVVAAWCELDVDPVKESKISTEINVLKNLKHPNILQLHHYQIFDNACNSSPEDAKVLVLLTEYMSQLDLKRYIMNNPPCLSTICKWGHQILMGLKYLHEQRAPVIHRDLKCANLFINESGDLVKIGDFGLATLEYKEDRTVVGTIAYRAPEIFTGRYNESVDIYSFGLCLLEMSTRESSYEECGQNSEQVRKNIMEHELPRALTKVVDEELKKIINNCLKFDPSERPTARELLELEYFKAI